MGIHCDTTRCTGCGVCVVACMDERDRTSPLRRIVRRERVEAGEVQIAFDSRGCLHCVTTKCAPACPNGCIVKDPETGLVVHNRAPCIGCGKCAEACPFGAISFDENHIIQKCDGCIERVRRGLLPACVAACPQQALQFDR
ncbi:4Fe-4S dicluster domain-containing protein [Papillibacter cinnamivorans]|uniref:4Fe-4S dicluster domain-containing protein n=1 Tax=Papillibacter cinnamivorans DSM 12816 TaxID=1122930 RepID=A0A1W2BUN0_9FIRM|nr:4Fe-4S dicluster domain-containing protein [Papillibacter cinnamivorans]SMC76581.1 4Fe-4S dicluster domain-containing protein [Papillibacter cinnamivorans DSM 12816]